MADPDPSDALPVVDVTGFGAEPARSARICDEVCAALENTGFIYVRGLGIEAAQIEAAFAAARDFFATDAATKRRHAYAGPDANFGYQAVEAERLDTTSHPDLKESFTMRNALAHAPGGVWPDEAFRHAAVHFYAASLGGARRMLAIMASCLGLPGDYFGRRHGGENVTLRFLHYPARLPRRDATQLGAGAHTDYGSLTLLFQDDVGGLEVRDAGGEWRVAPGLPGCVLVNTGDLMERWTNGRFRSTPHRVQAINGMHDRYSIALFVDPDSAVDVSCIDSCVSAAVPARYPPTTAGAHIRSRIIASHAAGQAARAAADRQTAD